MKLKFESSYSWGPPTEPIVNIPNASSESQPPTHVVSNVEHMYSIEKPSSNKGDGWLEVFWLKAEAEALIMGDDIDY